MPSRPIDCDIFCSVVDNYGDIGVSWRLARQLARERGWGVRLWVDDLASFARLCPALQPGVARQTLESVEIRLWPTHAHAPWQVCVPDIVIEAFACDLPPAYLDAMARRTPAPVWINLDYLSAEDWVADFHLLPSPHPRHGLDKTFFFPGLAPGTGGVLREAGLEAARDAFQADPGAIARLWATLGVPPPPADAVVVSLFAYENAASEALFAAWRDGPRPVVCLAPEGRISPALARFVGRDDFGAGAHATAGRFTAHGLPFTDQPAYDRLLWACDLNFVRGEDSFVRAQWAARPFVWHIYPQADDVHLPKLDAALSHYAAGLPADAAAALRAFWHAWNGAAGAALDWEHLWAHHGALTRRARQWTAELAALGELAGNLAGFCENRLK